MPTVGSSVPFRSHVYRYHPASTGQEHSPMAGCHGALFTPYPSMAAALSC